jgi:hypothetical protein
MVPSIAGTGSVLPGGFGRTVDDASCCVPGG